MFCTDIPDASTCSEYPDFTWDIDDHRLTITLVEPIGDRRILYHQHRLGGCELSMETQAFVVDGGDFGTWGAHFEVSMTGDEADCNALEEAIAAEDPDGYGFTDCVAEVGGEIELYSYEEQCSEGEFPMLLPCISWSSE